MLEESTIIVALLISGGRNISSPSVKRIEWGFILWMWYLGEARMLG